MGKSSLIYFELALMFIFSFYCINTYGQVISLDTTITWIIVEHDSGDCIESNSYRILTDTIINNKNQYLIYVTKNGSFDKNNCNFHSTIRDSSGYWFFNGELLYNFNLSIGDTLNYQTPYFPANVLVVYEEDSIIIRSEKYRSLSLGYWSALDENWLQIDTWIEGIGSRNGLFYPGLFAFDWGYSLTCLQKGDTIYHNFDSSSDESSCYCDDVKIHTQRDEIQIYLYPNPSKGIINFSRHFPIDKITNIKIKNTEGKSIPVHWQSSKSIKLPNFNGLFFVSITLQNESTYTFRIISAP